MRNKKLLLLILVFFIFLAGKVKAHCPLCTAGAAVAVGGATLLGINKVVIGLFIGAFAVSTGWMGAKWIKKEYIKGQKWIIILLAFLLTIIPLLSIFGEISPLYIQLFGGYGTLLNRTYLVNFPLISSIVGGIIVCSTPWLSSRITKIRGKMIPFQGILLTFGILILFGIFIQLTIPNLI